MANIVLIGASGGAGSQILRELSERGNSITAVARHPERIAKLPGVTAVKGDANNAEELAELIKGADVVISAVRFVDSNPETFLAALRAAGVKRYLVVGGAASLEIAPGVRLFDSPDFPDAYKAEAGAGVRFLEALKGADDLDWTFLSPSAMFGPGQRTGKFRLGKDELLTSDKGSSISFEDYAVAMADEVETPRHIRQRFTVGY